MDSQILMYQARMYSLVCQLESMKADNEKAKVQEDAPYWSSDHFDGLANDFQRLSEVVNTL